MEPEHLTLRTYTAEQLETFTRNPQTRPDQLSIGVLEALMIGHPLTKMPTQPDKTTSSVDDCEYKPRSHSSSIAQLAVCWQRLCSRLLLPYLLLSASVCFTYNQARDILSDMIGTLAVKGSRQHVNASCRTYFSSVPPPSVCNGILAISVLTLIFVAMATKNWAISVTDHVVRRTIFMASRQIVRRIHHLYGLFHTAELDGNANIGQPIIFHAYRILESCLRSKLFMGFCSIITALLCLICLVIDTSHDLLVLRWQVLIVVLLIGLFCCIMSNGVRQVFWSKVMHLLALAVSLLLINKVDGVNYWLVMAWQVPLQFVHSIRSVEVFNRTTASLEWVLMKHDSSVSPNWFFSYIQHLAIIFTSSFLLRLFNFRKRLNLMQVLFRYNLLLEPVESVTFLVAFCHMPPILTILMLRSQLQLMTPSEVNSLLLIGMTQSLFTSSRPVSRGYNDFITNSRQLCTLVPLATVCAIIVGSISSPTKEPSKLLLDSQATYKHPRAFARGLRRMVVKQTTMGCRLLLLLIVAHEVRRKLQFCFRLLVGLTIHSATENNAMLLNCVQYFLIATGCYLKSGSRMLSLIFEEETSVEKLLGLEFLIQGSYTRLIRAPLEFKEHAVNCNIWETMSTDLKTMFSSGSAPLMDTRVEHSAFLLLLRIAQNGAMEVTFFVCLLLVNVRHRSKLKLLASLPKLIVLMTVAVALVFALVNFVSSIGFY